MNEANRPIAVVSPPVGLPVIKIILAPMAVADNPLSTPLTPPMAAPAFLAVACSATADDPQLGHLIIFRASKLFSVSRVLSLSKYHVWLKLFRIES